MKQETVQTAARQVYEKPTMQVYEMEIEEAVLTGYASGTGHAGSWGEEANLLNHSTPGNIWENKETM